MSLWYGGMFVGDIWEGKRWKQAKDERKSFCQFEVYVIPYHCLDLFRFIISIYFIIAGYDTEGAIQHIYAWSNPPMITFTRTVDFRLSSFI